MHHTHSSHPRHRGTFLALVTAAIAFVPGANAAPFVSRLTPPSTLFSTNRSTGPIISRFLPGQRFDLQATISPDSGQTITNVVFLVDSGQVAGTVSTTPATVSGKPANTLVASLRAYSLTSTGVHLLTVRATQSDGTVVSTNGNFEIIVARRTGLAAKNVIILIGDGFGVAHRTAGRIMGKGVTMGKANAPLTMDTFPATALINTHSLNSICTDSSPGASCYATGNKANNNQHGVFPDDTTDNGDNPRVESIGEYLHRTEGRSLGIVTTTDLFDSTPGAFGSHTQARTAGAGIVDEMFDERDVTGLTVLMGGGRRWFLSTNTIGSARSTSTDYRVPADVAAAWGVPTSLIDPDRDLLGEFQAAGWTYAADGAALQAVPASTTKLLGLFSYYNMAVAKDKIDHRRNPTVSGVTDIYGVPDQPMLDEMTDKALAVLSKNPNGFVVMIEGGSIDKMAHLMDTERWITDVIEFDRAIARCQQFADTHPDTVVIVTADHECAGANVIGASTVTHQALVQRRDGGGGTNLLRTAVGTLDKAGFPVYTIAADGYPVTTDIDYRMIVGYACNADRYEDYITNPLPLANASHSTAAPFAINLPPDPISRDTNGNLFITGQIPDAIATHTASDILLSAYGRNASVFHGVMDNTEVFFNVMRVALGEPTVQPSVRLRMDGRTKVVIEASVGLNTWAPIMTNDLPTDVSAQFFRAR